MKEWILVWMKSKGKTIVSIITDMYDIFYLRNMSKLQNAMS
jgi:hypothetical protein